MEERFYYPSRTADAVPKPIPAAPKSNDLRITEALESIASELFHIRQQLESVTDGSGGFSDGPAAIRTTGR